MTDTTDFNDFLDQLEGQQDSERVDEILTQLPDLQAGFEQVVQDGPEEPDILDRISSLTTGRRPSGRFSDQAKKQTTAYLKALEELADLTGDEPTREFAVGLRDAVTSNSIQSLREIGEPPNPGGLNGPLEFLNSVVLSSINQGAGFSGGGNLGALNELDGDQFIDNLSTGSDPVGFNEAANIPLTGFLGALSEFTGRTITDPLTFINAPGLAARQIAGRSFRSLPSRTGRLELRGELRNRILALGDEIDIPDEVSNEILEAAGKGGVSAVRASSAPPRLLDELGVGSNIRFGPIDIPGTQSAFRAAGRLNVGSLSDGLEASALRAHEATLRGQRIAATDDAGNVIEGEFVRKNSEIEIIAQREIETMAVDRMINLRQQAENLRNIDAPAGGRIRQTVRRGDSDSDFPQLDEQGQREIAGGTYNKPLQEVVKFIDERIVVGNVPLKGVLNQLDPAVRNVEGIDLSSLSPTARAIIPDVIVSLRRSDDVLDAIQAQTGDLVTGEGRRASEILQAIGQRGGDVRSREDLFHRVGLFDTRAQLNGIELESGRIRQQGYRIADELAGLSTETLDHYREVLGMGRFSTLRALQKSADDLELSARAVNDGLPPAWADTMVDYARETYSDLQRGDIESMTRRMNGLETLTERHILATQNTIDEMRRNPSMKSFYGETLRYKSQIEELEKLLESDPDAFYRQYEQVVARDFFNPRLVEGTSATDTGTPKLLPSESRIYYMVADPDRSVEVLEGFRKVLHDWRNASQQVRDGFRRDFDPETAETLEMIETWHHSMMMGNALAEAMVIANKGRPLANSIPDMTREFVDDLLESALSIRVRQSRAGSGFEVNPVVWTEMMQENLKFMNGLKPTDFSYLNRLNKFWKPLVIQSRLGSFFSNNQGGAQFNNVFKYPAIIKAMPGIRRDLEIGRRAAADERATGSRQGTSEIWKEIKDEQRRQNTIAVYRSDIPYAETYGTPTSRANEFVEAGAGDETRSGSRFLDDFPRVQRAVGVAGREAFAFSDIFSRGAARNEALFRASRAVLDPSLGVRGLRNQTIARESLRGLRAAPDGGGYLDYIRPSTEGRVRAELALHIMNDRGGTLADAQRSISATHFDYWDINRSGQNVEEIMPFWLFRSRMLNQTGQFYASNPGLLAAQFRARNQQFQDDPFGRSEDDPRIVFGAPGFGLGFLGLAGQSVSLAPRFAVDSGFEDVTRILNGDASGFALENLSPFLSTPIEARTGASLGLGFANTDLIPATEWGLSGDIVDFTTPNFAGRRYGMVNVINLISGGEAAKIDQDGNLFLTYQGNQVLRRLVPLFATLEGVAARDGNELSEYMGQSADFDTEWLGRAVDLAATVTGLRFDNVSEGTRIRNMRNIRFALEEQIEEQKRQFEVDEAREERELSDLESFLDSLNSN